MLKLPPIPELFDLHQIQAQTNLLTLLTYIICAWGLVLSIISPKILNTRPSEVKPYLLGQLNTIKLVFKNKQLQLSTKIVDKIITK